MTNVTTYYGEIMQRTYSVEGVIYDPANNPLFGVTIFMVNSAGNPITSPFNLPDATYSAWTETPDDVSIVFKCPGFRDKKISFNSLIDQPDVLMIKSEGIVQPWMIIVVIAAVATYRKKKKLGAMGKLGKDDLFPIFLIVGGIIGFTVIQKILEKLGIWGGGNVSHEQEDPGSAWKPSYWQGFDSYSYAFTETTAKGLCKTIHDAFTVWQDDWNAILSVFSQMRTKANVSFLAWVFMREYDEDLLAFLTNGGGILPWDGLSTEHMNVLINMVQKLPSN